MTQQLVQALLNEHLVSAADIDEAARRQVVHGGSLDTNLLELGVPEVTVLRALGEAYRMPTGDKSDIDAIEPHIPRIFPLVFAETYRLVPYRLVGGNLGVLVNNAVDGDLFGKIRERLSLHPSGTITSEARMHYAMHRVYGVNLLPRFAALLTKLDGAPPTPLYEPAPIDHMLSWGLPASRIRPGRARGETRRGGPDVAGLLARLDSATDRDSVVEILLEIALGTFEFVSIFLVHGERIDGWRSTDPSTTQRVARISLPLAVQTVLTTVYQTRGHYLGPIPQTPDNMKLLQDLGRPPPRTAFVAPLTVGGRLAGILYADNGSRGVLARRVSGVLLLTHRVGLCFENLIRRRKALLVPPPPVVHEEEIPVHVEQGGATDEQSFADVSYETGLAAASGELGQESPVADSTAAADDGYTYDTPESYSAPVTYDTAEQSTPLAYETADGYDTPVVIETASYDATSDQQQTMYTPPFAPEQEIPEIVTDDIEMVGEQQSATHDEASYVAFAHLDSESPEDAVSGWEDVLVETVSTAGAPLPEPVSEAHTAPPAVTWEDVIAEARKAPALSAPMGAPAAAQANVEVAGQAIDPRELLLDGLDAMDPEARLAAIGALLPYGTLLDDQLRARFPGKLLLDPFAPDQPLPPLAECSGLMALLVARGLDAIPVVMAHLDSPDRAQRLFAIYMLLVTPYPPALEGLARRLYDTEPRNRFLAADALRSYTREPGYARILQSLREQLKVPVYEVQVTTVQVLGQLRDPRAVPSLIPLVVSPQAELASAAASALAVICAQAYGRDVGRWAEWWKASYNRPRESWLVASLRHPSAQVQRIAFSELQLLTGYSGGFDPSSPAEVREPVVRVWEKWLNDLVSARNEMTSAGSSPQASASI